MNNNSIIYNSGIVSVLLQFLTGLLNFYVLALKTSPKLLFIRKLLWLEVFVQIIEGIFYFWLFVNFNTIKNITKHRYYDWIITTPTMLLTYVLYLKYLNTNDHLISVIQELWNEKTNLIVIVIMNAFMLLFGYLGEIGKIPMKYASFFGFIPFGIMFYIIYNQYAVKTDLGLLSFYYFFIVWALYGVASFFNYTLKNVAYNLLDFFSKNFFQIFLSYLLLFPESLINKSLHT
jgi:bacteriorhodopsin